MKTVKYNGLNILVDFAPCCDTCKFRPFSHGYSGRKNSGYCCMIKAVVCRSSICNKHEESQNAKGRSIGGMKGQSKWIKESLSDIKRHHKYSIENNNYN